MKSMDCIGKMPFEMDLEKIERERKREEDFLNLQSLFKKVKSKKHLDKIEGYKANQENITKLK